MSEDPKPNLAFEVVINDSTCIVFAPTEARARWWAVRSWWDAFGRTGHWPTTRSKRAPELDNSPLRNLKPAHPWCPERVRNY